MSFLVCAGDVGFTRSKSLLGRVIRWFERDEPNEPKTWANHVLEFVTPGPLQKAECVEAQWKVQHVVWWDSVKKGTEIEVWRHKWQTPQEIVREREWLLQQVGHRYGWWKLLVIAAKRFTGRPLDKFFFIKDRPICSVLVALAKSLVGVKFAKGPFQCTPDNMHDFVKTSASWELVGRATR